MPRYYFNTYDGGVIRRDNVGTELPDVEAVRKIATSFLCEVAKDELSRNKDHSSFALLVVDELGAPVHSANLSYTECGPLS